MELTFNSFLEHLNVISLFVIVILLSMSIISWYIIFKKFMKLWLINLRANKLLKLFRNSESLEILIRNFHSTKGYHPFSNLAQKSINAALHYEEQVETKLTSVCTYSEFINRNMHRAIAEDRTKLESGLTILATVGSTAPFIGLFGTVIGIYDALISIGAKGTASLNTVAAPVGEALIMTAFGLAVAIPAVLAYNALVRGNRNFMNKLEIFAHDIYSCLNSGSCIHMKNHQIVLENI